MPRAQQERDSFHQNLHHPEEEAGHVQVGSIFLLLFETKRGRYKYEDQKCTDLLGLNTSF